MKIESVKITDLQKNPKNPRIIKDDRFWSLFKSVFSFSEMLQIRPIVCNTEGVIFAGNMRFSALQTGFKMSESELFDKLTQLGATTERVNKAVEFWKKKRVPIVRVENFTSEQFDEFTIRDNVDFGEWDYEALANEWDADNLLDWGVEIPSIEDVPTDLVGLEKNKPPKITITFENEDDLIEAQKIIETLIITKFEGSYYSVSAGEI